MSEPLPLPSVPAALTAALPVPQEAPGASDSAAANKEAAPEQNAEPVAAPKSVPYGVTSVLDSVAATFKRTRKTWTDSEKKAVLDLMQHAGSKQKTINELRRRYGTAFSTISRKTLKQWQRRAEEAASNASGDQDNIVLNKKRGRRTCNGFEDELLSRLRSKSGTDGTGGEITYTYSSVSQAANDLRLEEDYKEDEAVKRLKFSCTWVRSFLDRHGLNQSLEPQTTTAKRGRKPGPRRVDSQPAIVVGKGKKRALSSISGGAAEGARAAPPPADKTRRLEQQMEQMKRQLDEERQRSAALEQRCAFLEQQLHAHGASMAAGSHASYLPWPGLGVGQPGQMGGVYTMNQ